MKKFDPADIIFVEDDPIRTDWATFHRAVSDVKEADGAIRRHQRDFLERGNAISVLAYCAQRSAMLLVRQFRLPVYFNRPEDSLLLEVCGGMLHGQAPLATVHQEAAEELGVALLNVKKVFVGYSSPGSLTEKIDYYLAEYAADAVIPVHGGSSDEGELTEIVEVGFDAVRAMIAAGEVQDTRTIALFYCLMDTLSQKRG